MREILFRGKSKRDGKWIYGYLVKHDEFVIIDKSLGTLGFGQQVIPETIGQWTGLIDKNGTKIFEGDIVDTGFSWGRYGKVLVRWEDGSCGFEPFSDSLENCGHCGGGADPDFCEVIGNIHDNPEMEVSEK